MSSMQGLLVEWSPMRFIAGLICFAIVAGAVLSADEGAKKTPAEFARESVANLNYTIRPTSENDPKKLSVMLVATGHLPGHGLVAKLADWGEWTSASFSYLQNVRIDGRSISMTDSGTCAIPSALLADHRLKITYDLILKPAESPEHQERPLLPYLDDQHIFAFASNTLMDLAVNDTPLPAEITIRIDAPRHQQVFTGWAGLSADDQDIRVPTRLSSANGVFAIGKSFGHTTENINGTLLEVAQFATAPDAVPAVAEVARTMIAAYSSSTGRGPHAPVRILIERSKEEGVTRGTHTDAGLVVELPSILPLSEPAKELIAHELFHDWLGTQLVGDDSLVWFSEGFTDYFALWHAAAHGLTTPNRFANRILSIEREARSSSSFGRVKFADTGIQWRDDDGPNETLAYRGGALLAFVVDAELRRNHSQSVSAVIRGLFESTSGTYQLADIRHVMTQLGLVHLYEQSMAASEMPEASPLLIALGFDETWENASLTYLGIEARFEGAVDSGDIVPAVVTAIDSAGPAASSGLLVGDRIVGYGTQRGNPPILGDEAPQQYRFGLNRIPSGAKSAPLDIVRDGQSRRVDIAPVLVAGGQRIQLQWNPDRHTGFFDE
jgi:hypothetical protein